MEYIGEKALSRLIRENFEYSFIGEAITPWHAHSLRANILYLSSLENRDLKGIVIIKPHPDSGYMVSEKFFELLNVDVFYYRNDQTKIERIKAEINGVLYYLKLKKEKITPFYYIKPSGFRYSVISMYSNVLNGRQVVAVESDEGIGIHIYSIIDWYKKSFKEKTSFKKKLITLAKVLEMKALSADKLILTNHYMAGVFPISTRDEDKLSVNNSLIEFYRESFQLEDVEKGIIEAYPKTKYVLFNTQPLDDDTTCVNINGYYEILDDAIRIFQEYGYTVVIKPHPREKNIQKYIRFNCIVSTGKEAQETILAHLDRKPEFIIGMFSTTLISCKVLYDIKPISINEILISAGILRETVVETCDKFNRAFKDYLIIPDKLDELRKYL